MTWLLTEQVVADDTNNSGREQAYLGIIRLSREYCRKCNKSGYITQCKLTVSSKGWRLLQNVHISLRTLDGRQGLPDEHPDAFSLLRHVQESGRPRQKLELNRAQNRTEGFLHV